ncbi:MAG TPA: ATP-binding protein, partial [Cyclobacteriaceae bacterium]|nr:ATP-binding protein [Cyclobacteriaceae bacterium]
KRVQDLQSTGMKENIKLICFYGPESTGKTTMAIELAKLYQTEWVPEVAREFINTNDFTADDIVKIGYAQTQRILDESKVANKILFCDSDLITTQIYSNHYLGVVPEILYQLEKQVHYDLYFLFDIDTEWVADGLRDLGHMRKEMYEIFKNELEKRNIPYIKVQGDWEERKQIIKHAINLLIDK